MVKWCAVWFNITREKMQSVAQLGCYCLKFPNSISLFFMLKGTIKDQKQINPTPVLKHQQFTKQQTQKLNHD